MLTTSNILIETVQQRWVH